MNRNILTLVTKETSEAVVNGWKLNFVVESTNQGLKTIQVSGIKDDNYFSANRQDNGSLATSFSSGMDVQLISDVVEEFDAIVASFQPAEEEPIEE